MNKLKQVEELQKCIQNPIYFMSDMPGGFGKTDICI